MKDVLVALVVLGVWGPANAEKVAPHAEVPAAGLAGEAGRLIARKGMPAEVREVRIVGEHVAIVDPDRSRRRAAVYAALGGALLWAGSFALCVTYDQRNHDALDRLRYVGGEEAQRDLDRGNRMIGTWGTGLFAAGAAALGTSAYLYFSAREPWGERRVLVAPAVSAESVGVGASGRF